MADTEFESSRSNSNEENTNEGAVEERDINAEVKNKFCMRIIVTIFYSPFSYLYFHSRLTTPQVICCSRSHLLLI